MTGRKSRERSGRRAVGSDPLEGLDADRLSSLLAVDETDRRKARAENAKPAPDGGGSRAKAAEAAVATRPAGTGPTAEEPLERGLRALAEGRPGAAADEFRAALGADPGEADAAVGLGDALLALGELDRALEVLLRAQEAHPDHVGTRVRLGRAYARANAYPEARCELGVVLVKKGLYAAAIAELERALDLDAGQGRAHYYLGTCHNQLDQLDRAAAAFERAVEVDPGDARAWYQLGVIHDRKGHPDRALEMYRAAREIEGGRR